MQKLSCHQIVFFVVAAAAPLTGMLGAVPPAIGLGNGAGLPGAYLIAGFILLLFSVGFATMSRHVVNGGAFYAYVAQGLGRPMGIGAAFVAVIAYQAMQMALYGLFGFFCDAVINLHLGAAIPWYAYSFAAAALIQFLGLRNADTNSRVVGVLMALEIGILLLLSAVIIATGGGPAGLTLQPFSPHAVFTGHLGIAIMFALASFVGFEATAIYGEESHNPKRDVPLATYISVTLIMAFFAVVTWAIICAYGPADVAAAALRDPSNFWFAQSDAHLGAAGTTIMSALLLTSIFASLLAFHSAIARYLQALAQDGLLPTKLGRLHRRYGSPCVASTVQSVAAALILATLVLLRADPYTLIFSWMSAFGTIGIVGLQVLVSLAVIVFFRRTGLDRRAWHTLIAPAIGGLGLLMIMAVLVQNLPALSGTDAPLIELLPWAMAAVFVAGLLVSLYVRKTRPAVYDSFAGVSRSR